MLPLAQVFAGVLCFIGLLTVCLAIFLIKTHLISVEFEGKKRKRLGWYLFFFVTTSLF